VAKSSTLYTEILKLKTTFFYSRYNLQTPESDTDMFIVYQAKTSEVLGLNPPKMTIKVYNRPSTLKPNQSNNQKSG